MLTFLATEATGSNNFPSIINVAIAICSLVIGWLLKLLSERISEKTAFDHRLRLEKEYALYSDLWEKLFKLRRAVGQLVEPLGSTSAVRHDEQTLDLFNAYQAAVRNGEPFMATSVFDPARKIATLVREIINNIGNQSEIETRRIHARNDENDARLVNDKVQIGERSTTAFQNIEDLLQEVSNAIRKRIGP